MSTPPADHAERFRRAFAGFDPHRPVLVMTHNDADGLSAGALLWRALGRVDRPAALRILGRGENPWTPEIRAELAGQDLGGLLVLDLGVRAGAALAPGVPTIVIDHHVPTGVPEGATTISGYGEEPTPTTSLLAHACAGTLTDMSDLLWLAAVGAIGDLGDKAPFPEIAAAKKTYTGTALRELVSLVNAPRRTASGDPMPAWTLLVEADNPKDAIGGRHAGVEALRRAREEVKEEVDRAKRAPPRVKGEVALIVVDSPAQVHPLVAQTWKTRLKDKIVIAANTGFRPGWVHFAVRSGTGVNLIAWLRDHAPDDAEAEHYGNGHEQATGGALSGAAWAQFLHKIGHAELAEARS